MTGSHQEPETWELETSIWGLSIPDHWSSEHADFSVESAEIVGERGNERLKVEISKHDDN